METLEEAFEKWSDKQFVCSELDILRFGAKWQKEHYGLMEIELRHTKRLLASCEQALESRDKQAETVYSAEEVLELLEDFEKERSTKVIFAKQWFNKFKK